MRNKSYTLEMPVRYRELSEDEMEYDGGWLNFVVGIAAAAVGIAATAAGNAGLIDKNLATAINVGCTVVSLVCTAGAVGAVTNANALIKMGVTTVTNGAKTQSTTAILKEGVASLTSDAVLYPVGVGYSLK
jgi:hypothetical protein